MNGAAGQLQDRTMNDIARILVWVSLVLFVTGVVLSTLGWRRRRELCTRPGKDDERRFNGEQMMTPLVSKDDS